MNCLGSQSGKSSMEPATRSFDCYRGDGDNLIEQWETEHENSAYVENLEQLNAVNVANTDYLLGLFDDAHLPYDDERDLDMDPSLPQMVETAVDVRIFILSMLNCLLVCCLAHITNFSIIQMLLKGPDGFFLMVEGGRIDMAHHDTTANRALRETMRLDLSLIHI